MRTESNKHKKVREFIAELTGGKNLDDLNRKRLGYYPDVSTEKIDYEVEMLQKTSHLIRKSKTWNNGKKKILVIAIPEETEDFFDEVYLFYKNSLLK